MYRSAVGRTDAPRKLAGAELVELAGAVAELCRAEARLAAGGEGCPGGGGLVGRGRRRPGDQPPGRPAALR